MEDLLAIKCRNCSSSYSSSTRDMKHVPLVLWCGCTFCAGCLGQLCRGGGIKCPHCRRKTVVSMDVDLKEQLAPNYYLLGRITAKNLKLPRFPCSTIFTNFLSASASTVSLSNLDLNIDVPHARQQSCDECGTLGSIQCQQCTGVYCDSCFKTVHMSSNSMRRHIAVPLSQLQSGPTHCPTHEALLLDYYCTDDAMCVCSQCCITGGHKGHQVVPLKEIAESQREKLVPLIEEAKNRMKVLRTDSEEISNRLSVCRKDVRSELGRLEKQFSRSYTLLQLHQQGLTEQLCSAAIDAITPLKNMETAVHAQMQSVLHKVMVGEEALRDDYVLMKESAPLIDSLSSGVQLPLKQQLNVMALPKVSLDLGPFKQYLSEKFGTISANTDPNKSEVDVSVVVSGVASPAHPVTTPTSSRPPSALSECYLSGAVVGSERGSRASSYRSISPASPPRKPLLPVHRVNIDDTIDVWICHVVSVGEFYVQCPEQRLAVEQLSLSLSSLSPGALSADNLKEGIKCVGVLNEMWYRVEVMSIDVSAPVHATVKLIDWGRMENLPLTNLYEIPFGLSDGPPQCVQCCLHAVHPPKIRYQHHVTPTIWSPNTTNIFTELIDGKNFRMKVYRQLSSGVISVDLLLFDGPGRGRGGEEQSSRGSGSEAETKEYTSVIDQLIERGVAVLDNRKWAESGSLSVNLGAGDCLDVTVSMAESPWDFYVHLVAGEKDRKKIADVLSQHAGRLCPVTLSPYKNMFCSCKYSEDNTFYRGRVKELSGDGNVVVEFVDYGNCERVHWEELFELPGDLLNIPLQAVHCRLDGVHPAGGGPQSNWSEEVSDQFNELVGYPLYSMSVKEIGVPLSVELTDKETGQSLSDLLVKLKLAEYSLNSSQSPTPANGQLSSLVQPDSALLHSKLPLSRSLDAVGDKSLMIPPSLAPTIFPTAIPPPQPPAVGETITAKVVHISSSTHFYVQQLNTNLLSELNKIKTVRVKTFKNIKPGAACLARFHDDECYHRIVVLSVKSNMVEVFYVDYGNSAEISLDQIYPLTPELTRQPALALPCSLVREIPLYMLPVFSELVVDKTLQVTIKGVDGGPPTVLLVSLVDENGLDIEEKLLSSVYEKREEEKDGGKDTSADEATFSGTIASPELTTMTVCVTFVSPYGAVYGHDVSPGSSTTASLRTIEQAVELCCSAPSPQLPPSDIEIGQLVCAKAEDGIWYRATVKTVQDTDVTVYYVDYGNCEIIKKNDIITEAVCPDIPPQAVELKCTSLFKSLLKQPAERQTTLPSSAQQKVYDISMTEEQHRSLSQLLIDECITTLVRETDDRGLLIASCGVIDSWIKKQQESKQ